MSEIVLTLTDVDLAELFGRNNANLNLLKESFPEVKLTARGELLKISGEKKETQRVKGQIESMIRLLKANGDLPTQHVEDMIYGDEDFKSHIPKNDQNGKVIVYGKNGKPIKAKTKNQRKLVTTSEENDIVFAIGPAGTGKTYTAVAMAVRALKNKVVKKIILTRPAVEAGESLGFLPGDLKDKVDPYLRPLYDALDDMIPTEKLNYLISTRVIEVAPLAFMRGRTLDNAFIILDEAQNCTQVQIKMFLTRIGPSAKAIITGDLSQVDLPGHQKSGLFKALQILPEIEGIGHVELSTEDVVRHRLVKQIIKQYNKDDERRQKRFNKKYEEE